MMRSMSPNRFMWVSSFCLPRGAKRVVEVNSGAGVGEDLTGAADDDGVYTDRRTS